MMQTPIVQEQSLEFNSLDFIKLMIANMNL